MPTEQELLNKQHSAAPLVVDERWSGEHGIARFSTEVIRRLNVPWRALGGGGSPTSPMDLVNSKRWALPKTVTVFSPGFNAGITRARQVVVLHDLIHLEIDEEKSLAKAIYYNVVVRRAVRKAGVVLTVSKTSAKAIRAWVKSDAVEIVIVGNGRSEEFVPVGVSEAFTGPTFVYVGNLKPHKNVEVLFDAIAARPDYRLVVVTGDVEAAAARVSALSLSGQVSIKSGVSDSELAALYRGATGALQPSLLEGFGLPALEAMSCGTRVAYWGGCDSVSEICDGTGVRVDLATSSPEWAQAMDSLVELDQRGPLKMSEEWNARYDWDTVARNVNRVLVDAKR